MKRGRRTQREGENGETEKHMTSNKFAATQRLFKQEFYLLILEYSNSTAVVKYLALNKSKQTLPFTF